MKRRGTRIATSGPGQRLDRGANVHIKHAAHVAAPQLGEYYRNNSPVTLVYCLLRACGRFLESTLAIDWAFFSFHVIARGYHMYMIASMGRMLAEASECFVYAWLNTLIHTLRAPRCVE